VNWRSRRSVLTLIGIVCLAMLLAGAVAAFMNRHHTLCSDGRPPVKQRAGIIGQTEYLCHNGRVVTTS
jgi:hypothetical protein